ncbi:uncharacterized protein LOC103571364 [Microplitis demolitor]|uniref:uncharacterized protein LOC103571364 n=1 Tax=Microplitis demolitor TaxID=69319 RepID=UPI0004CCE204|nr:uncharacterized protein LOC103571364 [Microplitis demolitor]
MKSKSLSYNIICIAIVLSITTSSSSEFEFYQDVMAEGRDFRNRMKLFESDRQQELQQLQNVVHKSPFVGEDISEEQLKNNNDYISRSLSKIPQVLKRRRIIQKKKYFPQHLKNNNILDFLWSIENLYVDYKSPLLTSDYSKITLPRSPIKNQKIFHSNDIIIKKNNYDHGNARLPESENFDTKIITLPLQKSTMYHIFKTQMNRNPKIHMNEDKFEFTYNFHGLKMNLLDTTFAITPNDPRYNENGNITDDFGKYVNSNHDSSSSEEQHTINKKILSSNKLNYFRIPDEDIISNSEFISYNMLVPGTQKQIDDVPILISSNKIIDDAYSISIISGSSAAIVFVLVFISLTWYRYQRRAKATANIEYPAYGVTGPNKDVSPSEDQRLAQSAQMYHFQHQKQQIIALEKTTAVRDPGSVSEAGSDEENDEGDYTVYECPGLAPAGEIEVKNPLFFEDPLHAPSHSNHRQEEQTLSRN